MALTPSIHAPERGWRSALPDLVGCAVALLLAWFMGWRTGDLIWSMWLASLVIGYSLILWTLFGPLLLIARQSDEVADYMKAAPGKTAAGISALVVGKLVLLVFFTIHFGGFHWGHSMFVNTFYPISPEAAGDTFSLGLVDYWHVVKTYGWFLPLAFLAQRDLFKRPDLRDKQAAALQKSKAEHEAGANAATLRARQRRGKRSGDSPDMGAAYKGVLKLHCLIFFLFGADALGLPEFLSYTVVYLVYFFPWGEVFGGGNDQIRSRTSQASR